MARLEEANLRHANFKNTIICEAKRFKGATMGKKALQYAITDSQSPEITEPSIIFPTHQQYLGVGK